MRVGDEGVGALLLCWEEGTPALGLRVRAASGNAE